MMSFENFILILISWFIVFIASREIALAEVEIRRCKEAKRDAEITAARR